MSAYDVTIFGSTRPSNVGGVRELYLIPRRQVVSVYDPIRHSIPEAMAMTVPAGGIAIELGTQLYKMKFPPLQCAFSQQFITNDHGTYADVQLQYNLPGQKPELEDFYLRHADQEFVCLFEDANGRAYLVGNEEKGLRIQLGQSIGNLNLESMTLSARLTLPRLFLPTLVLSELFPESDFSPQFSLVFNS